MSLHPAGRDPFGAPHLRTTSEVFKLNEFLMADKVARARWCAYVADTAQSLRNLEGQEPTAELLRKGVAVGLGMSEAFRRFVSDNGGAEEARIEASYIEIVQAGAGTIVEECSDRRENGGRHDKAAR